jgi:hypothetical protein
MTSDKPRKHCATASQVRVPRKRTAGRRMAETLFKMCRSTGERPLPRCERGFSSFLLSPVLFLNFFRNNILLFSGEVTLTHTHLTNRYATLGMDKVAEDTLNEIPGQLDSFMKQHGIRPHPPPTRPIDGVAASPPTPSAPLM